MNDKAKPLGVVPADPTQWSNQRSVAIDWMVEYIDKPYTCWRCRKDTVFSAEDQKYTYEVKKAPIDQHRILCTDCWRLSLAISEEIGSCEANWASSKVSLSKDKEFLSRWLRLLISKEEYVPYRPNTAAKNMLQRLLNEFG